MEQDWILTEHEHIEEQGRDNISHISHISHISQAYLTNMLQNVNYNDIRNWVLEYLSKAADGVEWCEDNCRTQ